ncbi:MULTISPECIES: GNAT family N-acetyltransferase [Mycolicibacterium]|uniref:Acetyltransferase n=1 Tax=Mycolicibacterium neoaurum TaxID=1795 RepID=A0AAV2WHH9_MYCNE|nr:GNAT family N-acetyltransferase [Mycolicibacterium neoaurum]TLH60470.1 GNAT family N-acetyltransferase [Mycolicibacterium neoaurum]CDQ43769.1 acetyltransferase [Mycolicibacterium neoaurum]SDE71688.1 N-acetylglutamate synthase, GNAT family [Mycolicibacterium neoaurum]
MSSSIRAATADDIAAVEQIVALAYRPYIARIGRAPAPMTADYRALLPHTHVLTDDDAVAGVLVAIPATDHLLVDNVAVDPRHHGRGFGRRLLEYAEQQARRRGLPALRLYTNAAMTENLTLYPRLGYTEVDRRIDDGFDRVFFSKALPRTESG